MQLLAWASLLQATACVGHLLRAHQRDHAELEALSVSETMQRMAESLPDGVTKSLLESFKVCGQCRNLIRFGEAHDGGYLTCMDGVDPDRIQGVYSIGVEGHDKWSLDMFYLLHRPVNQFDCTVAQAAQQCPTCRFYQACLQAPSGAGAVINHQNWALQQALDNSGQGHASERSLVMKMDIEGSEWPLLAEMTPGGGGDVLKKFQQVIFEFHGMDKRVKHAQYLKAMQNLLAAGFRVAHVHGNNNEQMYREGPYSIPNVVEVTFISSGQPLAACQEPQLSPLDTPNRADIADLPAAHLP